MASDESTSLLNSCEPTIPRYDRNLPRSNRIDCSSHNEILISDEYAASENIYEVNFKNVCREVVLLTKLALPCMGTAVMMFMGKLVTILMVGHIGSSELAAASLAVMFANVLGYSLCYGITTGLDTLAAQAVTGALDKRLAGIILQRAIIINTLVLIPIVFIWLNTAPILQALGQDHRLSEMAGKFTIYLLPSLFPNVIFNAVSKFLQAQGLFYVPTWILAVTCPLNILFQWLLTWYEPTAIGYYGAPLGSCISDWLSMLGLILYTAYIDGYQCWHPWTMEAFRNWGQYLQLAIPGLLMTCAEWWIVEAAALLAGTFGELTLATQSVLINTCAIFYYLFLGISIAVSNRVGNLLGAFKPEQARFSAYTAVGITIGVTFFNGIILISLRHIWAYIFTSGEDVAAYVAAVLPIVWLFQIGDGGSCVTGGILRGSGKQKIGALANLVAYYIIGLSLGLYFVLSLGMELVGIWWGLASALTACLIFQAGYIHFRINWSHECIAARARVNQTRSLSGLVMPTNEVDGELSGEIAVFE